MYKLKVMKRVFTLGGPPLTYASEEASQKKWNEMVN